MSTDPKLAKELLLSFRRLGKRKIPADFQDKMSGESDSVAQVREDLTTLLTTDLNAGDLPLVRLLYDSELASATKSGKGETLYQLANFLFVNGDINDIYRLYAGKFQNKDSESAALIDEDMLLLGKHVETAIDHVENDFRIKPALKEKFEGLLEQLQIMRDAPVRAQGLSGAVREFSSEASEEEKSAINFNRYLLMSNLTTVINFESELAEQGIAFLKEEAASNQIGGMPMGTETRYYFSDKNFSAASVLAKQVNDFEKGRYDKGDVKFSPIWLIGTVLLLFIIAWKLLMIIVSLALDAR